MNEYLEIPLIPTAPPWSTNQERRMNRYERGSRVKEWKVAARQGWRMLVSPETKQELKEDNGYLPPSIVQVFIPFPQKRDRDPHNYCGTVLKAVIDGLVAEELWPNDTPEWVGHREPILIIGLEGAIRLYRK